MVHSAVGVDDGVLHEAAVLVDLLLGDLRFRGRVSRRAILASRRRRGGCSGVAAAACRLLWRRGGGVKAALQVLRLSKKWRPAGFSFLITTRVRATWGS